MTRPYEQWHELWGFFMVLHQDWLDEFDDEDSALHADLAEVPVTTLSAAQPAATGSTERGDWTGSSAVAATIASSAGSAPATCSTAVPAMTSRMVGLETQTLSSVDRAATSSMAGPGTAT